MPLSAIGEQAISDLFRMIDTNNDGFIDSKEQQHATKKLHSMTMPKGRWTWADKDTNGDGRISMSEWLAAMQAIADKAGEEHLLWAIIRSWNDHPLAVEIRKQPDACKQFESLRVQVLSSQAKRAEELSAQKAKVMQNAEVGQKVAGYVPIDVFRLSCVSREWNERWTRQDVFFPSFSLDLTGRIISTVQLISIAQRIPANAAELTLKLPSCDEAGARAVAERVPTGLLSLSIDFSSKSMGSLQSSAPEWAPP